MSPGRRGADFVIVKRRRNRISAVRRDAARRCSMQRGFTLVEAMVTLATGALALGLALPSLRESVARVQLATTAQEFLTSVHFARSEAIRRGQQVTLRRNGTIASGGWERGWTMFADANGNGVLDTGEQVIRVGAPLAAPLTMVGSSSVREVLAFSPDGRPVGTSEGVVVLCHGPLLSDGTRPRSRAVLINGAGRSRMAPDTNGDGVPEKSDGPLFSCTDP